MLMSLKAVLTKAGLAVETSNDGDSALARLTSGLKPDLIISDVNMPGIDGIDLVRKIRANAQLRFVPILMLTTESEAGKRAEAKAAGATGWLVEVMEILQRQMADIVDQTEQAVFSLKVRIDDLAEATAPRDDLIGALYAELQFQDVTRQGLDGVGRGLDLLTSELRAVAGLLTGEGSRDDLVHEGRTANELAAGYVMNRQRTAHLGRAADADAAPPIELF